MEVSISGSNLDEELESYTRTKVGKLDRILSGLDHAEVHFWEDHNPRIPDKEHCEVTLEGHGHHIRCKVSASDRHAVIDVATKKLEKQLRKEKTMQVNKWHTGRVRGKRKTRYSDINGGRGNGSHGGYGGGQGYNDNRNYGSRSYGG